MARIAKGGGEMIGTDHCEPEWSWIAPDGRVWVRESPLRRGVVRPSVHYEWNASEWHAALQAFNAGCVDEYWREWK